MGNWYNSDGLYIPLGVTEATVGQGGEYEDRLANKTIAEIVIPDMTVLTATAGATILENNLTIPVGARIEEVQVAVETACTGATAALNIGLIKTDRSTEVDFDGLVAAAAVATLDTAGKRLTLINGTTAAGALIGTTVAYDSYLCADYDTAAFTAGKLRIRVFYYMV